MVLRGYQSAWIPVSLLQPDQQDKLVDSLFAAAPHWEVVLHVNKGLAGAGTEYACRDRHLVETSSTVPYCRCTTRQIAW